MPEKETILHILHRQSDEILGTLNSKRADFWTPLRKDSLENKNTFEFMANANSSKAALLEKRNRVLLQDEDGDFREYIITYAEQPQRGRKFVISSASFVDLGKAKVIYPQELTGATSSTATQLALSGTEWQAGVIDFTFIRTIKIESHTNPLALLFRIAAEFGLEIRFRVVVKGNQIVGRYVDMRVQIAGFEGKEIEFGKDLVGVKRKENSQGIVTALLGIGPEKEDGTRLTVLVEDEDALQRWGRDGQHLIEPYEPESTDTEMTEETLRTLTENELKKRIDAFLSYECEAVSLEHTFGRAHEKIRLGQTVRIKDGGYNPPLYLEARIRDTEVDPITNKVQKFVIGNFIEYKKADLEKSLETLKKLVVKKASVSYATEVAETARSNAIQAVQNGEVTLPAPALEGTIAVDTENPISVVGTDNEQEGEVKPGKTGFNELYVGKMDSPNVVERTTKPLEFYVAAEAVNAGYDPSDTNGGTSWYDALLTVNEAIRRIPKYVDHDVTIWLAYGQEYPRGFSLYGFAGSGTITIKSTGLTKAREFVYAYNNTCNINLENIDFYTTSSYVAVHNKASTSLYLWNCRFYGLPNNGTDYGVRTTDGGFTKIITCEFYSVKVGVMVYHGGRTYVYNITGNCSQNAFYASGGTILGGGSAPDAPAILKTDLGGSVNGFETAVGTGGDNNTAPPAAYTTNSWGSTSGNNWSTQYNSWNNDGVKQGNYGYGRRTGFWFFGTAPSTAVSGKTIKSMRVYITRASKGGSGGKVPITLRWHTHTSQPSSPSDLDLSAEYTTVSLGYSEPAWVSLPASFFPYFQNGTAKGIGVYSGDSNYAILLANATLEITYA